MTTDQLHQADAVFEGGGVKGIALLGALSVMEKSWRWENLAGTSAGAIVAAFAATGMSAQEIRRVLDKIDLSKLMDTGWEEKVDWIFSRLSLLRFVPHVGKLREHIFSIIKDYGIYEGNAFMRLVEENLPPGVTTFGDLIYDRTLAKDSPYRYKLRVVASDITANRMLILPQDIQHFGRDPDDLRIAEALRMSMSIPIFFEPWTLQDKKGVKHYIVDGGLLSNFPVWMFDSPVDEQPAWPTFGFDLHDPADTADGHAPLPEDVDKTANLFDFAEGIVSTLASAIDRRYAAKRHWARTIPINNLGISTTKFNLTAKEKDDLGASGVKGAAAFMEKWGAPEEGFAKWKDEYRMDVEDAQREFAKRHGIVLPS